MIQLPPAKEEKLQKDLSALSHMQRHDLIMRYESLYGKAPLKKIRISFLILACSYKLQENAYKLRRSKKNVTKDKLQEQKPQKLRKKSNDFTEGTVFMRKWNGRTYQVTFKNNQFIFNDKSYSSLSKIATEITGTSRSGPKFFGVT